MLYPSHTVTFATFHNNVSFKQTTISYILNSRYNCGHWD